MLLSMATCTENGDTWVIRNDPSSACFSNLVSILPTIFAVIHSLIVLAYKYFVLPQRISITKLNTSRVSNHWTVILHLIQVALLLIHMIVPENVCSSFVIKN